MPEGILLINKSGMLLVITECLTHEGLVTVQPDIPISRWVDSPSIINKVEIVHKLHSVNRNGIFKQAASTSALCEKVAAVTVG